MKYLFLLGIIFLIVVCVLLSIGIISYVRYVQTMEYLETVCNRPGSSCPGADTNHYDFYVIIGTTLIPIGIILLFYGRKQMK